MWQTDIHSSHCKIFTEKITLKIKQQQLKIKINLKTELYQLFKDTDARNRKFQADFFGLKFKIIRTN